jgi:hypothetical protein
MLYDVCCSSSNSGLYVKVHSLIPLLPSAILSSVVIGRCGRRWTGRSGMLSEFWLPVKIPSVLLMFVRGSIV